MFLAGVLILGELPQKAEVDLSRLLLEDFLPSLRNTEHAAPGVRQKTGHLHVGTRPRNTVIENTLLPAGQECLLIILRQLEFLGKSIECFTVRMLLAVGAERQEGKHYALEIRYCHIVSSISRANDTGLCAAMPSRPSKTPRHQDGPPQTQQEALGPLSSWA